MYETMIVAIDGSGHARLAVAAAGELAARLGATLHLLHVLTPGEVPAELREFAEVENIKGSNLQELLGERVLQDSETSVRRAGASNIVRALRQGEPAPTILGYAREVHADMVVLGRRGLGTMQELLLGSVSHKVIQHATCSCLIVQ